MEIDALDARILQYLQKNCSVSIEVLGEKVGLSRNAVWRRIRALEDHGYIKNKVAIVDPHKVGLELIVFIQVKTSLHDEKWRNRLAKTVKNIPQILFAHRMTGELDYLIMARVSNMA